MKIKEMYCEVCNHLLDIRKDNVYEVNITGTFFGDTENYDATDCPYCGCQNVLKKRYKRTGKCLGKE